MAEDNEEKKELDPLITQPHGVEQQAKMEIVHMIHSGESPFDIIYHIAKRLEKSSGEPGYAQYVEDQIRAVYGFALEHVKPMQDELGMLKNAWNASKNPTKILNSPRKNISVLGSLSNATRKISNGSKS